MEAGFNPRQLHMVLVVDKLALRQVFMQILQFLLSVSFHQYSIINYLSTQIS